MEKLLDIAQRRMREPTEEIEMQAEKVGAATALTTNMDTLMEMLKPHLGTLL